MSHSLRAKIKCLRYKGIITDKDCDRLRKALGNEDVLEDIKAEIQEEISKGNHSWYRAGMEYCLEVIDKHISGKEQE